MGDDGESIPPLPAAVQDWAADVDDDDALPPLAGAWAEDDDDELPPLAGAWAEDAARALSPAPPSSSSAPPFRGGGGGGAGGPNAQQRQQQQQQQPQRVGGNFGREAESPWTRGGNHQREQRDLRDQIQYNNNNNNNSQQHHQLPPRDESASRPVPQNYEGWRRQPGSQASQAQGPVPSPDSHGQRQEEVRYPSRDEQRAAAAKREEDEAWKLSREPLTTFFTKAPKGQPFPLEACRELLNALSEPPFAEGRLAPRAKHAFTTVAAHPKAGPKRRGLVELEELVRGVVNPLYHLLSHGVTPPKSGAAGEVHSTL